MLGEQTTMPAAGSSAGKKNPQLCVIHVRLHCVGWLQALRLYAANNKTLPSKSVSKNKAFVEIFGSFIWKFILIVIIIIISIKMDVSDDIRQHLSAEKDKFKQQILENLAELYFLRNNGLMCDFPAWSAKEFSLIAKKVEAEDIINEHKFSQLLNRKFDDSTPTQQQDIVATTNTDASGTTASSILTTASTTASTTATASITTDITTIINTTTTLSESKICTHAAASSSQAPDTKPTEDSLETPDSLEQPPPKPLQQLASSLSEEPILKSEPSADTALPHLQHGGNGEGDVAVAAKYDTISLDTCASRSQELEARTGDGDRVCHSSIQPITTTSSPHVEEPARKKQRCSATSRIIDQTPPSATAKEESPCRISKVVEPIVTPLSVENHNKQLFERAKHEASVTARIAELRKLGLWSAKRLPKLQEPPRNKTHWDYLLEEMQWLSSDFESERKWKRKTAKKCAIWVYRYHQEKRSKTERAEREHLQHIKKVAASQAKEIRSFWASIEKIVDFRQQTKLEETRKKAMGLHLNYILDQTSKFSNTCLEDTKQLAIKNVSEDYNISQDGENTEKEPVINVSSHFSPYWLC